MTDPVEHTTEQLLAAELALDAAVQQLIQPSTERIDRAGQDDPLVRETDAEDREALANLDGAQRHHAGRLHTAITRGDGATVRRTTAVLGGIVSRRERIEARMAARRTDRAELPSLLNQLRDAVQSSSSTGGAASAGAHRSPIGLAAAELLGDMERTVRAVRPDPGQAAPTDPLAASLRRWAGLAGHWRTDDPARLVEAARAAEGWVTTGRAILTPARRLTATGACPVCGRSTAHVRDDAGEVVRRPALELDLATGSARCIVPGCTGYWPPDRIQLLAAVLETQAEEARAAGG